MSNPYIKPKHNFALSEARRLLGGGRFVFLPLYLTPLVLALAGGVDLLNQQLYAMSHQGATDKRLVVVAVKCWTNQKLCSTDGWDDTHRMQFWPFRESFGPFNFDWSKPDWWVFIGLFWLALIAYGLVGNDKFSKGGQSKNNGVSPLPDRNPQQNWIIGGRLERRWLSDPGMWQLSSPPARLPYVLNTSVLRTGLVIVAPTGAGKTSSIFEPAIFYFRQIEASAIFWDAKGQDFDASNFDLNFDLDDSNNSFQLELFSGRTPEQAGERLGAALIPELSDEKNYFSKVAKNTLGILVSAHYSLYRCFPEPLKLLLYLKDRARQRELLEGVYELDDHDEGLRLATGIMHIMELAETKGDLIGSLRLALEPLTTPHVARKLVANQTENSFSVEKLLRQPGLVRLALPVADSPDVAPILGRLVLAQFNYSVLSPDCNNTIFKAAVVDEAASFISPVVAKGMTQARSNNAAFLLALQTLDQISDRSLLNSILAAAGTKIVMKGVGEQDAERFSRTFGELELPYRTRSRVSSRSSGSSHGSRSSTNSNSASSSSTTTTLKLRPQFTTAEIRYLPQYHAIIECADTSGRSWPPQIIDMSHSTVSRLKAKRLRPQTNSSNTNSSGTPVSGVPGTLNTATPLTRVANPGRITAPPQLPARPKVTFRGGEDNTIANMDLTDTSPASSEVTVITDTDKVAAAIPAGFKKLTETTPALEDKNQEQAIRDMLLDTALGGLLLRQVEEVLPVVLKAGRTSAEVADLVEAVKSSTSSLLQRRNTLYRRIKSNDFSPASESKVS